MKSYGCVNICGVPTSVATWGIRVEDAKDNKEVKDIILMIPGNPGYIPLYDEFLDEVYTQLGIPVWIIGHAGHEPPTNGNTPPPLANNEELYNTHGQIIHKQFFIEKYVPENARLHLVGYSIGAYIIIELLKIPSIWYKTMGCYCLFPTIERLSESPYGKVLVFGIRFQRAILLLIQVLSLIPKFLMVPTMSLLCFVSGTPTKYGRMYLNLLDRPLLEKSLHMGVHELNILKERDTDTLKSNRSKIRLFYGSDDGFVPQSYCTDLKRDVPGINAEISTAKFKHEFLSKHSKEMGCLLAEWIRNQMS